MQVNNLDPVNMKNNNEKGQGLVEIVVSLGLTILMITGLVSLTSVAIRNANFSRSQSLAKNLGEQAIENARVYRNQNGWNKFFTDKVGNPATDTVGIYTRLIEYEDQSSGGADDKVLVTSTVSWSEGGRSHQSKVETLLTKWQ